MAIQSTQVRELDVTLGFMGNGNPGYNGSMTALNWTRVLFEAIDDAVFVHDEAGNILDANPAACRRLGYTRDELLKLNTRDIDAPEFAVGFQNRLQSQLATGGMRIEGVHRTKNGRRVHVDINTSAIQLDGKPAVLAVMRDITQRKETEDALGKQSELLQSILDNMSDAIVVADAHEQIVLFNPMAEHVFGPGLLQGTFALYQADRTTPLKEFPVARCVRGESFDDLELFVRHEGSPTGLSISVAGRPLRVRGGARTKGGVLVCHDITAAKRHERRVQAQNEIARIIAAGQEFSASAREILRILCEALDFEAGLLWQADPAANALECLQSWHHPQLAAAPFLAQSQHCALDAQADLLGAVWSEGQARRAHASDAPWVGTPRWHAARQAGLQAVFAFPIRSGEKTIGVLEFWQQRIHDDEDAELLTMLQTMANQVGQFLDRQRVEKALRDSQALYESLVDCLPQNIFRKDRDSRWTFGNRRFCATLKRTLPELLGMTDFQLFPEELARKYVRDDRHVMETGKTLDDIESLHLPDGNRLFIHVVKTPVYNAENEIIGVQGIFWDVTQEVMAQEAVATSEKSYRQLTEATMDGIVVIDHDGNITLFNPAAERMFGWRADEVVGSPARLLVPEEFNDLHAEGVGRPQEFQGKRKDGSDFPVEIALSGLTQASAGADNHDRRAPLFLAAIRDLTERNKMRAVLVQNEKLASIGLLSAGVAHEINNPLAFVANNLVVLERDCKGLLTLVDHYEAGRAKLAPLDPDWAGKTQALADEIDLAYVRANMDRIISRTRDGIERVARIVHSLRGMARTEAPRRQDTRIPDLINSSLEILHGKFKRLGIAVHQDHDANPVVPCVPTQISQVVLNLLVNAFQAVEARHRPDGRIDVRTRRIGDDFLLEIQDNGVGINPEHRARLFDPFFTTKDVGEGTGLGLSISHHIINAHGGRIEVESRLGEGTCFRVHLPLKESRTQP